jgi:hypothetical protein
VLVEGESLNQIQEIARRIAAKIQENLS